MAFIERLHVKILYKFQNRAAFIKNASLNKFCSASELIWYLSKKINLSAYEPFAQECMPV